MAGYSTNPDASLTINGELSVNQGLENSGHLINSKHDLLDVEWAVSFFNEGEFSGSITGNSYQQNVVNTGEMTVTEDGTHLSTEVSCSSMRLARP